MDPCHLKAVSYLAFEANISKPKLCAFLPKIADFDMLKSYLCSTHSGMEIEHTDFCTA